MSMPTKGWLSSVLGDKSRNFAAYTLPRARLTIDVGYLMPGSDLERLGPGAARSVNVWLNGELADTPRTAKWGILIDFRAAF